MLKVAVYPDSASTTESTGETAPEGPRGAGTHLPAATHGARNGDAGSTTLRPPARSGGGDSPLDQPLPHAEAHALQLGGAAAVLLQDTRRRRFTRGRCRAGPQAAPAPLTPSPCSAARYSPATISLCSSRNRASSAISAPPCPFRTRGAPGPRQPPVLPAAA